MKVLVAPDKFRGSFDSRRVAELLAEGVRRAFPRASVTTIPLADGGEGTLEVLRRIDPGEEEATVVPGPLGDPVTARWLRRPDGVAVLESAQVVGLDLVPPDRRDPLRAGTEGLGALLLHCLESGCRRFLIGLGGTATVDGGAGMARALGYRFLDERGRVIGTGEDWSGLRRIDPSGADPRIQAEEVTALCDVSTPLLGPGGAARRFGPQKGASPAQVARLERRLEVLARAVEKDLRIEVGSLPMGGAAGGLGAGIAAFLRGRLTSGADFVLDRSGFDAALAGADLVLTGEGRLDAGTAEGKAVYAVLERCRRRRVPVVIVCGEEGDHPFREVRVLDRRSLFRKAAGGRLGEVDLRVLGARAAAEFSGQNPKERTR
ncbi:MAG: glycerate kinase [Acidobacteria bacterium]|nr:glycerate kinase [Acidobacteriota bacterium]